MRTFLLSSSVTKSHRRALRLRLHMVSRESVRESIRPQVEAPRDRSYETHRNAIPGRADASDSPNISSSALIKCQSDGELHYVQKIGKVM